ncbi:Predicted ATPase specific for cyanobacteria [Synechococcus sp. RCC307]|nr:Predicted ATPase specific for cyanobacteria [Synechococcus sp. RCC307]
MAQTWLISGPPGCGKTTWMLNTLKNHQGQRGYLRLPGISTTGLEQADDGAIDQTYLQDQITDLIDLSNTDQAPNDQEQQLNLIELTQFEPPSSSALEGVDSSVIQQLEALGLRLDRALHFGRDDDLPKDDTLEFSRLEAWSMPLERCVWDPNSLSSFWFELVNGAYGDVYRAKALMNLPDGRAFFCNWMVSQGGSQFLPLESVAPPDGRPKRCSMLSVQGKALDGGGIQATIADCLLSDEVLELHQEPQRQQAELTQAL